MIEKNKLKPGYVRLPGKANNPCQLYAESIHFFQASFCNSSETFQSGYSEGVNIQTDETGGLQVPEFSKQPAPHSWIPVFKHLSQAIKPLQMAQDSLSILFDYQVQDYSFTSMNEGTARQETVGVHANWNLKDRNFFDQFVFSSLESFFSEWETINPLKLSLEESERTLHRWPAPSGILPVHWSARAIAKIVNLFCQAFEGDRVISKHSFLSDEMDPFDFHFYVEDNPPLSCDQEGSPAKPLLLCDGKAPTGLATNLNVARILGSLSTGHGRRASYANPSVVSLWNPTLGGITPVWDLSIVDSWGISVLDLQVSYFDHSKGTVKLEWNPVRLIHQGTLGEAVEPILWEGRIWDLMRSLDTLSAKRSRTGLLTTKSGQRFATYITAPEALSSRLEVKGSVPLSYYWD